MHENWENWLMWEYDHSAWVPQCIGCHNSYEKDTWDLIC